MGWYRVIAGAIGTRDIHGDPGKFAKGSVVELDDAHAKKSLAGLVEPVTGEDVPGYTPEMENVQTRDSEKEEEEADEKVAEEEIGFS